LLSYREFLHCIVAAKFKKFKIKYLQIMIQFLCIVVYRKACLQTTLIENQF